MGLLSISAPQNYSSWSMRPWVLLRQGGIALDEVMVRFDSFSGESRFKQRLGPISPAGRVPVLVDDGFVVSDTLAIAEYVAEKFPEKNLWPQDPQARARAASARKRTAASARWLGLRHEHRSRSGRG